MRYLSDSYELIEFYRNNIKWNHHLKVKLMQQWRHLQLMLAMGQQLQASQEKGNTHHGQMLTSYFIWIMAQLEDNAIIVMFVGLLQHPRAP